MITKKERIDEGTFYFDELKEHLQEWKSPLYVHIHLDDTRIKHRVEYGPSTGRFVGLVLPLKDGLPVCDAFILDTFDDTAEAYKTNVQAKYAHVILWSNC